MNTILWFAAMLFFAIVEAGTVGLVSIWFAAGSLAAMIAATCGATLEVQIILAVGVSVLCLAALRPLVKRFITPKLVRTNVDAVLEQEGIVTEAIDNLRACGAVKVGAVVWTARSTTGEPIPVGATVQVDRVEGVKLFVSATEISVQKIKKVKLIQMEE